VEKAESLRKIEMPQGKDKRNYTSEAKKVDRTAVDRKGEKDPPQAETLLRIAHGLLQLFHNQHKEPFCFVQGHTYPLKSVRVKELLGYQYYLQEKKAPYTEALNQAINVLKGKALFESPLIELHNRIAREDGAIWYDLGDGTAIKVVSGTWGHTKKVPILFRQYSHQRKQVLPEKGGNPWSIFNFINVDEEHRLLVLVYVISCYIPGIPHPIAHPHGPQGSGKTTFCRVLKDLIDPSALPTLIMQQDYAQLIQAIAHHHFVPFDNLSDLPGWASDILAIACTGGGLSKRQLYTDEEDIILSVQRCISINAINLLISRADLMDRAILLHLERIAPNARKDESEFWANFERKRAMILGGIFDVFARAMQIYESVNLHHLPRMADFAKWGFAIGEALQHGGGNAFLKAYDANINRQTEEIIQNNTLLMAVLKQMNEKTIWEGTIKSVYDQLRKIAQPDKDDPSFPKTERSLRKYLERVKTTLNQQGINFTVGQRTAEGVPISFKRTDFPKDTKVDSLSTLSTSEAPENESNVANEHDSGTSWNEIEETIDLTGDGVEIIG
jgi:hypothetical protein